MSLKVHYIIFFRIQVPISHLYCVLLCALNFQEIKFASAINVSRIKLGYDKQFGIDKNTLLYPGLVIPGLIYLYALNMHLGFGIVNFARYRRVYLKKEF